nr:MAG: putative RNA-dependent RNA polymerase [Mitoviridae sp.]
MIKLLQSLAISRKGAVGVGKVRSWQPDLKVWHRLMAPLISVVRLTIGRVTKDRIVSLVPFCKQCSRLARHRGIKGVVLWLKVCNVLLMQALPGSKMKPGSREIGKVAVARSRDGLPRIIPKNHRRAIRNGDILVTRLWLTLFGLYRILPFKGRLKVDTIVSPGVVIPQLVLSGFGRFIRKYFFPMLEKNFYEDKLIGANPEQLKPEPLPLTTSGSNSEPIFEELAEGGPRLNGQDRAPAKRLGSTSSFGARGGAAWAWLAGAWGDSLWNFLNAMTNQNTTLSFWRVIESEAESFSSTKARGARSGKIATKVEPAGKVRVFAIVDYWTQCALKPLHDFVFGVLRTIPQDGTFDQERPVKRLLKRSPKGAVFHSFDLSAATDRCPVVIQELIVAVMFGVTFAYRWREILVERDYWLPKRQARAEGLPLKVRYSVGQPMGAYSSWAVFALTHHAIVQFAAYLAGHKGWFELYALLGDDIVIADVRVANKYKTLCKWLGMGIGISKSMVNDNLSCEFAKKVFVQGKDCAAFPWKLWSVSQRSLSGAVAALQRVSRMGLNLTASQVALAFGAGMRTVARVGAKWENIPSRLRAFLVIASHPSACTVLARPTWIDWLATKGPMLPVLYGPDVMTWFNSWAQPLLTEVLDPLEERVDALASRLFFGDEDQSELVVRGPKSINNLPTVVERFLSSKVNNRIVAFQESCEKARASLKHLQRLDIKLLAYQSSAIFKSVVDVVEDRASAIAEFGARLNVTEVQNEAVRLPMSLIYSLWERWRVRALKSSAAEGTSPRESQGPRPKAAPEIDTRLPSELEEEEGWVDDYVHMP